MRSGINDVIQTWYIPLGSAPKSLRKLDPVNGSGYDTMEEATAVVQEWINKQKDPSLYVIISG
ncbi:hypothetical protein ADILRU_1338 [Leifsonia rubra CMS 76R]|nr:hypothetical protein ADILRU_1338 [Leifsonia rubra CMS 76R]